MWRCRIRDRRVIGIIVTRLCWYLALRSGTHDNLCSNLGIKILVLIKSGIVSSSGSIKGLQGDFGCRLRTVIELGNAMHAFNNLSLDYQVAREARVEEHNFNLEAALNKSLLYPADEISIDFLQEQKLDVWNVGPIAAWDIQVGFGGWRATPVRTRTAATIIATAVTCLW